MKTLTDVINKVNYKKRYRTKMNRLFRHITRLALAGIILTVAGCAYDDTVRDLREQTGGGEGLAISFSNGVIENP